MNWIDFKLALGRVLTLDKDALHIYAGLVIQVAAAFLLRRTLASWLPWLCVLFAVLVNEWLDLRAETWPDHWQQYRASIHDIVNTLVLPTGLLVAGLWNSRFPAPAQESRTDSAL